MALQKFKRQKSKVKMKLKTVALVFLFFLICSFKPVFADSTYVLPYPSFMPGSFLYKPHLLLEEILKFWYFGNFGQFEYNLKESDKYLVEAKTLFEYNQFLEASKSLKKSNYYFQKTLPYLLLAQKEGKNISEKKELLRQASAKHIEVLEKLSKDLPDKFTWTPEKRKPTVIYIKDDLKKAISERSKFL